jgi:2-amino-4-hydroxy-6-hydroxymethyldihydropteridine diphosphokinase
MDVKKMALGLGSNLGDRQKNINKAVELLTLGGVHEICISKLVESEPVDCPDGSGLYLNGALSALWSGSCRQLLILCQQVEQSLGRPQVREVNSPRPIDIDILLFGSESFCESDLIVPHPRMLNRDFVMTPLAEVAGSWIIPNKGITVKQAAKEFL